MSYRIACVRLLFAAILAVVVLQVTACKSTPDRSTEPGAAISAGSSTVAEVPTVAESPMMEGTGPEKAAPPVAEGPSINVAHLPYGPADNTSLDFTQPEKACKPVKWLGPDIPAGMAITIDEVDVQDSADVEKKSDAFTASLDGCRPRCGIIRGPMPKNSDDSRCQVAVTAVKFGEAELVLRGKLTQCPAGQLSQCQAYATLAAEPINNSSIFVNYAADENAPPTDETTTSPTDETTTSPTDSPTPGG